MPTTVQRIELQGGDDIKRQFVDLGAACKAFFALTQDAVAKGGDLARNLNLTQVTEQAKELTDGLGNLVRGLSQAGDGAQAASDKIKGVGDSADQAGGQVDDHISKLASYGKAALIAGGGAVAFGAAIFGAAKKAADGAKAINDAADASGTSLASFQKANFVLTQLGLSSDQAAEAIKKLTDDAKSNAAAAADKLQQMGFFFTNDEAGIAAATAAMKEFGLSNNALAPILTKMDELNFRFVPTEAGLKSAIDAFFKFGQAGGSALQKIKDATPDATAQIRLVAETIAGTADEASAKQLAINAFGDELGPKLVDKLKGGKGAFDEIIADFQRLNPEITEAQVQLGTNFAAAMSRFQIASNAARIEFGSNFLPVVTEGIVQFTNLLRLNSAPLNEWAKSIATSFASVVSDVLKLVSGNNTDIQNSWLLSISNAITQVLLPAFHGLGDAVQPILDKINGFLGIKISLSDIGLAGVVTFLLGGFNSLLIVATALFTGTSPLLDKFRASLSGIGIDFDKIKTSISTAFSSIVASVKGFNVNAIFHDEKGEPTVFLQTVYAIVASFVILRAGAGLLAPILSKVIGKEVSGDAVLFAGVLGQITGLLGALDTILVGAAAASTLLANGMRLVGVALSGAALLVGWPLVLAAAIATAIVFFGKLASILDPLAGLLNKLFGTDFFTGIGLAETAIGGLAAAFVVLAGAEVAAGQATGVLGAALNLLVRNPLALIFITLVSQLLATTDAGKKVQDMLSGLGKEWAALTGQMSDAQKKIDGASKSLDALNDKKAVSSGSSISDVVNQFFKTGSADQQPVAADATQTKGSVDALNQSLAGGDQKGQIQQWFDTIKTFLNSDQTDITGLGAKFESLWSSIGGWASSSSGWLSGLSDQLSKLVASAQAAASAINSIPAPPSGAGAGGGLPASSSDNSVPLDLAEGGQVFGPGTTTSDSIPAWLSKFEFVQPARRVFQYGVDFMEAVRRGSLSVSAVRMLMSQRSRMPSFSMGGIVNALSYSLPPLTAPRFAAGGLATGAGSSGSSAGLVLQPLHIHLPDGRVVSASVLSPNNIAGALNQYAIRSRSTANGRRPNHGVA